MGNGCILVIRRDDRFSAILRDAGHQIINLELIETNMIYDLSELRTKLRANKYDGLFFTSPVAAQAFVMITPELNGFRSKAYVLGKRSREVLSGSPLELCCIDEANSADEMIDGFGAGEFAGKRFLFLRGDKSLRMIPERLSGIANVDEAIVYTTMPSVVDNSRTIDLKEKLSRREIKLTCFFSPSGVDEFVKLFGEARQNTVAAAIGSTTADAARKAGLSVEFVSPIAEAEGFAKSLVEHINGSE